jgi:hypothetical protein
MADLAAELEVYLCGAAAAAEVNRSIASLIATVNTEFGAARDLGGDITDARRVLARRLRTIAEYYDPDVPDPD